MAGDVSEMGEVRWERNEAIVTLWLNRPERRNAITTTMLAELIYACERCAEDETIRAVILRGAGPGFCPGDELRGMGSLPEEFGFRPKAPVSHQTIQALLRGMAKPTIAVIHGFAFGVGLDLAMACDFRICSDDAKLQDQRVIDRGMHAVTGCAWFQPRAIGVTRALEFLILGEPLTGAEAVAIGMTTRSVAPADLDEAVEKMAQRLAAAPTKAIGLMKRQVYEGLEMDHATFMEFGVQLRKENEIEDRLEGIAAFLERRPAKFTGR